jgi:hypothetical protein
MFSLVFVYLVMHRFQATFLSCRKITIQALVVFDLVMNIFYMSIECLPLSTCVVAASALVVSNNVMNCFYMRFESLLVSTFVVTFLTLVFPYLVMNGLHVPV